MDKLECMRYAGKVNLSAIEAGFSIALPGYSLLEIEKTIEDLLMVQGCKPAFKNYHPDGAKAPFPGAVCLSVNDGVVHGVPNSYVLKPGDLLTIDLGTEFKGWFVDAARSRIVPGANQTKAQPVEDLIYATECIIKAQLDIIKNECTLLELVEASEVIAKQHSVYILPEFGGHAIGDAIHKEPFIPSTIDRRHSALKQKIERNNYARHKLLTGEIICIEPVTTVGNGDIMIDADQWTVRTKDGSLACHTERCIIVQDKGYELLT